MTLSRLCYELPQDREAVAEIVRAIPSNWCWIDGQLSATRELYQRGQIAENTRLFISRFYSIKPTIIGSDDVPYEDDGSARIRKEGIILPKISDIILRKKLFSSVSFNESAFESNGVPMDLVKELAEGFIQMGYKGWIDAFSGYENNHKYDNPERFSLTYASERCGSVLLPPNISLCWNPKFGGKKENLDGIIIQLEKLRLKQIEIPEND